MTTDQPRPRGGALGDVVRRAARHRLVRAGGLLVALVVCSGSWWDPRSWVSDAINGMLEKWAGSLAELAESMLLGAFDGSLGSLNTAEWTVATVFTGRLGAVMGVFAVAFCVIEVIAGMAGRDPMRILKGTLIAMFAWPLTATAAWATIKLTNVSDSLSTAILAGSPAKEVAQRFFAPLQSLIGGDALVGGAIVMLVFALFVLLPTVLLSLVMAFRSFGLLVAVAFAPVALMTQGWAKMRGMARGWATIVGALLVTKPLAAGIIVISLELIESMPDVGALVMGVVGLWMAAFAPVAAASLFNFAGGEVAAAQGAASAQAGRHMVGAARATAAGGKKVGKQAMGLVAGGAGGAGLAAGAGGSKAGNLASVGSGAKGDKSAAAPKSSPGQSAETKPASSGSSSPASGSSSGTDSSAGSGAGKAPAQSGSAGQHSGPAAPGTAPTPAPAASTGSAPGATRAGGGSAPSSAPGAPQRAPAHASASTTPGAGPGWGGDGDGRGAGFVSSAGGFGATTGIGDTPSGVTSPGGALSTSPGGPSVSGGAGVTTSAASGAPGSGTASGAGSGPASGPRAWTTGAPVVGGGVTSTGAGPVSRPGPAVTGAGGVTGAVVDDVLGAVSDSVEIKGDETK